MQPQFARMMRLNLAKALKHDDLLDSNEVLDRLFFGKPVSDIEFDQIFPRWIQTQSPMHWTPVSVAQTAARLLALRSQDKILDVGSGAGKFCVVGALSTDAVFYGIEQRESLVQVSKNLADQYRIPRVHYLCLNVLKLDWNGFDGFYFFNPFGENRQPGLRIDRSVVLDPELYGRYARHCAERLKRTRLGTRVAIYHGLGCEMPSEFEMTSNQFMRTGYLELWVKAR